MDIKTKFNLGQEVLSLRATDTELRVIRGAVRSIYVHLYDDCTNVNYYVGDESTSIREGALFASTEELLNHINKSIAKEEE